jgi:glucose-6-phosphate 1-dehydrogenase
MSSEQLRQPLLLVIFGITGDLAQRKLLPALYQLAKAGELPDNTRIVGVSRRAVDKTYVYQSVQSFVGETDYDSVYEAWLTERTEMRQMDLSDKAEYEQLLAYLQTVEQALGDGASRLYYLSIPAQAFMGIVRLLGETGHNAPLPGGRDAPRLLIEKPFGHDEASAKELIRVVDEHFGEGQAYRIDHYLAKETAQNILTFRFQNPLFETVWNNRHIASISVVTHETIGIEGRTEFYEQTGALRDLIQSHLLQLLAITTMDKPEKLESEHIHVQKLALLRAVVPIVEAEVGSKTLRGQYEGYRAEVANPTSRVETFARLNLHIDNDTWRGVEIVVETGKALEARFTEVTVTFKQPSDATHEPNKLVFRIFPKEGISLDLQAKRPGIQNITENVEMQFNYAHSFAGRPAEAYERVIVDAMRGDQTLFATADEVLASWHIVEHVLQEWSKSDVNLHPYPVGSQGPQKS